MKIIPAGYAVIAEADPLKKIEFVARTCYKSEDKITPGSSVKMFEKLMGNNHTAMLEHADLCMSVDENMYGFMKETADSIKHDCYKEKAPERCYLRFSEFLIDTGERLEDGTEVTEPYRYVISGNIRAWLETFAYLESMEELPDGLLKVFKHYIYDNLCPQDFTEKGFVTVIPHDMFFTLSHKERMLHETFSVKFTVDRGVTHELVRMRECSFAQESTRYCNYSSGKFGNELTFIKPLFFKERSVAYGIWENACSIAESQYMNLVNMGVKPQEARSILPNSIKSEIVVTANLMEWRHIFNLRACDATGPAHPQMKEVMVPLLLEMQEKYPFAFGNLKPAAV